MELTGGHASSIAGGGARRGTGHQRPRSWSSQGDGLAAPQPHEPTLGALGCAGARDGLVLGAMHVAAVCRRG
jgi:hypothetical protein